VSLCPWCDEPKPRQEVKTCGVQACINREREKTRRARGHVFKPYLDPHGIELGKARQYPDSAKGGKITYLCKGCSHITDGRCPFHIKPEKAFKYGRECSLRIK
jgi:hypothetical protein